MNIITRKEAKLKKLRRYYTDKPCKRGHLSERETNSGGCLECRKEKESTYSRAYYERNREQVIERQKIYTENNRDRVAEYMKEYQRKNSKKLSEYMSNYYKENKEKFVEYARRYRERNKDNFNLRYTNILREIVRRGLFVNKSKEAFKRRAGYDIDLLIERFDLMFEEGMTWENHGEWHIDHIKPISKFLEEGNYNQFEINALSNLQPLWAEENLKKGA